MLRIACRFLTVAWIPDVSAVGMEQIFDYKKIGREEKREIMRREKEKRKFLKILVFPSV
jgi:hypothetical protein